MIHSKVADDDYDAAADIAASIEFCYRAIRERMARGGPPWVPPDPLKPERPESDCAACGARYDRSA